MLDPRYILARTVLLDALEALGEQRGAVIVVGAQAVYLHARTIDLAVPEFTLDADITIDPSPRSVGFQGFRCGHRWPGGSPGCEGTQIAERVTEREQRRLEDKDALDVLRLLQAKETPALAATIRTLLRADVARDVTREALDILKTHFTDARAAGPQMAVRAAGVSMLADVVAASCAALASDLLRDVDFDARGEALRERPGSDD